MQDYKSTQQSLQAWRSYAPGVDEVMSPPPAPIEVEQTTSPNSQQTQAGLIVIVSVNLTMTAIIMTTILLYGGEVDIALERGIWYFTITTPIYLAFITGMIPSIINRWLREYTERKRIKAYERVMLAAFQWRTVVEENRAAEIAAQSMPVQMQRRMAAMEQELLERRLAVDPQRQVSTFVTAYDNRSRAAFASGVEPQVDTTAQEAITWLSTLYNDMGEPDRTKVQLTGDPASIGRLKERMLGSSRGGGTREAGMWLIDHGVIKRVRGGYLLNLRHFPTRESLRNLL